MSLPPLVAGRRYAVRAATPSPGDAVEQRDVVGVLLAADAVSWTLLPDDRGPVDVEVAAVRAVREVPARAVRPSSSVDDLQRLMARGWPGLAQARLGGWLLREGGGCTGRANSALVAGDPGVDVGTAVEAVEGFYRERGLAPRFQLAYPLGGPDDPCGPVDEVLARRGYARDLPTLTMVCDLREQTTPALPDGVEARWADAPDAAGLEQEGLRHGGHPQAVEVMTAAPARCLTLLVDGRHAGRARLAVVDDWAGLSDLVVEPGLRGRGLGRAALHACGREARDRGLRFGYLQVLAADEVARGLYGSLGWRPHHRYHYRVATS